MLDPSVYICPPSFTSFIIIISHHCSIILSLITLTYLNWSNYSANGPGTVGQHQQWEVPAPLGHIPISCHLITVVSYLPIYSTNVSCVFCQKPFWSLVAWNMKDHDVKLKLYLSERELYHKIICTVDHINYCWYTLVDKFPFILFCFIYVLKIQFYNFVVIFLNPDLHGK